MSEYADYLEAQWQSDHNRSDFVEAHDGLTPEEVRENQIEAKADALRDEE